MSKKTIEHLRHASKKALAVPGRCYVATSTVRSRTIGTAHENLQRKYKWYQNWHQHKHHKKVHVAVLGAYLVAIVAFFSWFQLAKAGDLNDSWDFSSASGYTLSDSSLVEVSNGTVRLKALNYTSDANTMGLWHFDENTGSTVADDSSSDTLTAVGSPSWAVGNLVNALTLNGSTQYLTANDSSALSLTGQHTLEGWVKFSNPFSSSDASRDQGIFDKGSYKLYYDSTSGRINYEIANSSATTWTRQAGIDTKNSWDADGKNIVRSIANDGTNAYYGLGLGTGDAEVWKWDGSNWTKIGGDGLNGSWADQVFEDVNTLAVNGTTLYAGLGTNAAGDAEVWSCNISNNCTSWTKIGGDGLNSGWPVNTHEAVLSLKALGSNVYAGLGLSANDAEVWRWNGSTWTQVGGDSLNGGWTTNFEGVRSLESDGSNLYAGLGDSAQDAEVWRYNGSTWTRIGGDGVNSSWATADNIEQVLSLNYFGGNLYAGTGLTAGDGDVWRWNGSTWTKIGGDGLNSGWAASTYEIVASLTNDGSNLYAGLGNSNGDGEVFRWNGSAWAKIGGDGVNSGFSANEGDGVYALDYVSSTLHAGLYDSAGNGLAWTWNGSAWTIIGGGYVRQSWGGFNAQSVETSATHNDKLYIGTGTSVAGNATVWAFDGDTWQIIGGQGIKNSWARSTYENVYTLQSYKGNLYAGIGTTANDAEVWKYDGNSWTQVGGDSLHGGWTTNFESVLALTVYNDSLCAGLGLSAQDAEVWCWNDTSWTRIGGDGVEGGWAAALNIEAVYSLAVYRGELYAGLGNSTGDAEVWRWNGSVWAKVGGDGVSSSWNTSYEENFTLRVYNDRLVTGLGSGTGDAEVWSYDGSSWTRIGGSDVNGSWTGGTYERVRSMAVYNGELIVGLGDTAGDGEVWKYDGVSWVQIGGDGLNSGWTNVVEYVSTLIGYKGKLYAGTGFTGNADAAVWSYGNNAFLSSSQTSQDSNWHHISATFDGTSMKIYVDGVESASVNVSVSIPNNNLPLLVGTTYGSGGRGEAQGKFGGSLDELRISNIARTSFQTKPYTTDAVTVELTNAIRTSGVWSWDTFTAIEAPAGGTIAYRLSDDGGSSWKYWNGSAWASSGSLTEVNSYSVIDTNIDSFPVTFSGIKWQAVLQGNGDQQVAIDEVALSSNSDSTDPSTNASAITMQRSNGGASVAGNGWTNGTSPYFSWTAATDAESGVKGYCLSLSQTSSDNPITTKGILGTSPVATGGNCQFVVSATSIDLATSGYLGTPLTSSNSPYYLNIRAIDNAGNISDTNEQFQFRYDNTLPTNPGFITAPSGFINTKAATLTWPSAGGSAAQDANSGVAGLQYRINGGTWYGDGHSGSQDAADLLANDGTYVTVDPIDYDELIDGVNTFEFRTWDNAGNFTSNYVQAELKINTSGAPSQPQNVTANPSSNTTNSFAFSWDAPATYVGDENNITYCYTINATPNAGNCTFTSGGITSLGASAYATQPGVNTFYVVARDESSNINYATYASVTFTANTVAPGIPLNTDIVDVSIKSTSNWRLALTWDPPGSIGSGVASYKIYRSTNNTTFVYVGSSTSTTYIDAGLAQQEYFYRVKACDSTNNCGADSSSVSMLPTGKFTTPANLTSDPEVANITTRKATISWTTDRPSDSKIAIGTKSGEYSPSELANSDQVTNHVIDLTNLQAGTTYYYLAKWTDEDGNTGTSGEQSFTTAPAPTVKEVATTRVGLNSAAVQFSIRGASQAKVYFGQSEGFGGLKLVNTSTTESSYVVDLPDLVDGVKYFYKVNGVDGEGNEYEGSVLTFTTPQRPKISNVTLQPVEGEPTSTQKVGWTTNVPTTSQVVYGKVGATVLEISDSQLVTEHEIVIQGLEDDSEYSLIAQSRDGDGNLATSEKQVFRTALDTRPPKVTDVTVETTIRGVGSEARGQLVVTWKTDEPSTSQVAFGEGASAASFSSTTTEDAALTTEHIVIISDLATAKVYNVQAMSKDKSGNQVKSDAQSTIVGRASDSVLSIIFNTLQKMFGFLGEGN